MIILARLFVVAVALILPLAAGLWLCIKRKGYLKPVLLGFATFLVFQILTRIPLLQIIGKTVWFSLFSMTQPVLYALFLAGTAALFEEGGRWIVMRLFMKQKHRLSDGIAFGIGHGGCEAVLLVGINAVAAIILNAGSTNPWIAFAGGIERLFTMVIQIGLSVMVLKSVALKKPLWLLLAFAVHTAIDLGAVLLPRTGASVFMIEACIGIVAAALLAFIVVQFKKYQGGEIQCKSRENLENS